MKIVAIIPARFKSTRFPGKPLSDICGKPMIWWVYQHCKMVPEFNEIYVATDDATIEKTCMQYDMDVIMTSDRNLTGTDRVAEVAEKIKADLYVNVQGDEPLMEPSVMSAAIQPFFNDPKLQISNCMTAITNPIDVVNFTIPKVIVNEDNIGIYLTRSPAPYPKGTLSFNYYKQVCVYGFKPEALSFFKEYGKIHGKAKVESIEDLEILRFIENGYKVQYVEVKTKSIAVDTAKDLEKVRSLVELLKSKNELDVNLD